MVGSRFRSRFQIEIEASSPVGLKETSCNPDGLYLRHELPLRLSLLRQRLVVRLSLFRGCHLLGCVMVVVCLHLRLFLRPGRLVLVG